jgi:hypothetical protein
MRKVKIAYYYEDQMTQKQVIEYTDGFLIGNSLALSIADNKIAVLERVKPSKVFSDCYEPDNGDYMQFNISEETYDHIMRNYENMSEIELLNIVTNCD